VAAGWAHSLALRADGTVLAWGNNDYDQTEIPASLGPTVAVAAGYYHSIALKPNGRIVTWGWDVPSPVSATNIVAVAAGWEHCLALRADGAVLAWGDNTYGQASVPLEATNIVALAAGYYQNLALRADGKVIQWGKQIPGLPGVPLGLENVTVIAAGEDYGMALDAQGKPTFAPQVASVTAHAGQPCVLTAHVSGEFPVTLQWVHDGVAVQGATNRYLFLATVQPGDGGSYVLTAMNARGQTSSEPMQLSVVFTPLCESVGGEQVIPLGDPAELDANVFGGEPMTYQWLLNGTNLVDSERVSGATSSRLNLGETDFSEAGVYSVVAANAYGTVTGVVARVLVSQVLAWGDNSSGQLELPAVGDVIGVAAGYANNLALEADGTVLAWGDNSYGQCNVPVSATDIIAISCGEQHCLALRSDGTVLTWGSGPGTNDFSVNDVIAIAAGAYQNVALRRDGTVVHWGDTYPPTIPSEATNITAVAAGRFFKLALRADGQVFSWGNRMVVPSAAKNVTAIAAGGSHALALRADGTVVAWGNNFYGQASPPQFSTNVVAIAAGGDQSLALLGDGTVVGWGANYSGQNDIPAQAKNVVAISAGAAHSLALLARGVAPRPLRFELLSPAFDANTPAVLLRLTGLSGQGPAAVEISTNLLNWEPLFTNPPTLGHLQFLDTTRRDWPVRYYRASETR
jgi:alpha-tubulin suppressor-like RCC1 family protein